MAHRTVKMEIGGEICKIDIKVKELIEAMNMPGSPVGTFACCQGSVDGLSYVAFNGELAGEDEFAATAFVNAMLYHMIDEKAKFLDKEPKNAAFLFVVEFTEDGSIAMRWFPRMYDYVLRAAKLAVAEGYD